MAAVMNMKEAVKDEEDFVVRGKSDKIDMSKVKDLYDEEEIMGEIEQANDLVMEESKDPSDKKRKQISQAKIEQIQNEQFAKDYLKAGGI